MEDGGRDRKHRCDSTRGSRQHGRGNARLAPFLLKSQEKKGGAKLVQSRRGGGPYTVPDTGGETDLVFRVVAGQMHSGGESRNPGLRIPRIRDYAFREITF